ncbi:MAG: tRNA (adenosine(37)-N6)-threonylcarbamoyltransferase complex ATPase subunit type 1 TsaE [Chlorobi bacterium]|jgi:tRNA threonylcarbamoyladenosine biosynthesis protein TsaE|nr:tRNA (adenosine(37)-N6)-threonylcarbamoyltransferase complex ATPase subunit type 1 TsaE [Chlorobiota bacterium]
MDVEIFSSTSPEQTQEFGQNFALRLKPGDVVAFYGELGAGKTEFIKGICAGFRVEEIVSSPTFTVVNQYEGEDQRQKPITIFHVDLYRITSVAELQEVGFGELIQDDHGVKLVEWAEYAKTLLPPSRYDIHFYNDDADSNTRRIEVMQLLQLQSTKNHAMP